MGSFAQQPGSAPGAATEDLFLIRPDRVFDGEQMHEGWTVLVHGRLIEAAGPAGSIKVPANATIIDAKGATLLPGLIEGHSHLFLHPYNETSWNDQVLKESRAERVARATVHARKTLLAGFTTVRD
ncbi:MAG: amidohydrolase family protein, partial [Bacteroidota bacterium]|nr:amidohydrolase family protein [Bacteroidota bacterium]